MSQKDNQHKPTPVKMGVCQIAPGSQHFDLLQGKSILESAEASGIKLAYGCRAGVCGTCYVTILEGQEALPPMSKIEEDTLRKIGKITEGRLACRVRNANGKVTIQPRL